MSGLYTADVECRAELRAGSRKIGGYAAVFEQTTDLGWMGKERLQRGAFDTAMSDPETDIRALFNHSPLHLLGRQSSGTLRVSVDSRGLEYEVDLPNTAAGNDVRELVERGDITGASFAFVPDQWTYDERSDTRTHTSVARLVDVSPVPFPAYEGATTQARARLTDGHRRSNIIRVRHRAARRAGGKTL